MIFVTLGTQNQSFKRLLKVIDDQIEMGVIKDEVVVQAGYTTYSTNNMKLFDYIPIDEFNNYLKEADLIITHGGVGSILQSIMLNKKVIAVARLSDLKEHENNHQIEIVSRFNELGYILGCTEVNEFAEKIKQISGFTPRPYESNNKEFCALIKKEIDA